jgi:hypothetical protein
VAVTPHARALRGQETPRQGARHPILHLQEACGYTSERHATWMELFFDLVGRVSSGA